jgi:cell division protease FtsH
MDHFEEAKDKVMLGAERKSLVLTENERTLTAYHEAGHAVLGLRIPGLDTVHKVTIVPRGRALGITASLPEEDRHTYSKDWLEGQLAMLFGGRVAEEIHFGTEKITTGAGNDIDRATSIARRMVTQFGMSDVIGLMSVGDADHEVFLGRELVQRREVSQDTARKVDSEVKRILDEAHERAREILDLEGDLLKRIAEALLERETLDRNEIRLLAEGKPLPPLEKLIIPGTPDDGSPLALPDGGQEESRAAGSEEREGASVRPAGEARKAEGADEPEEAENTERKEKGSPLAHALDRKGKESQEELSLDASGSDQGDR